MTDNAAIDMLVREHEIITKVVLGLHGLSRHLREGRNVDASLLREAVSFMREFADKCHHAKEEEILFPALVAHGVPLHGCPLDALLHEHSQARHLVGQLDEAVESYQAAQSGSIEKVIAAIEPIERLYPDHIWKEDQMVFPMLERLVPAETRRKIFAAFEKGEARKDLGAHERFHQFAALISAVTGQ